MLKLEGLVTEGGEEKKKTQALLATAYAYFPEK